MPPTAGPVRQPDRGKGKPGPAARERILVRDRFATVQTHKGLARSGGDSSANPMADTWDFLTTNAAGPHVDQLSRCAADSARSVVRQNVRALAAISRPLKGTVRIWFCVRGQTGISRSRVQ